ncbi:sigma-70 factor domain-containing protein, partial [Modestobacter italicus]|uniref:sigma-70 factor domain-containing protein n=1 Tax=Modestobacter italicus (strain DSM 44449 / CECT 9708 / BC 501) TaxID=2732864 RepID=UPI0034D6DEE1
MPADQPGPDATTVSSTSRSRTVAARSSAPSSTAPVTTAAKKAPAKKAPAKKAASRKPTITPSPGTGEGTVLTAVASDGAAVAVVDGGAAGLKLDETVVTGKDGVAVAETDEKDAEGGEGFEWDDEEESEALRQARKDAELTASADSVRAYLKQIGKVALLTAEEEVDLAKRIEAGLYGAERLRQVEEEGQKLSPQMRRDLNWIVRDGERAKNHLLEANLRLVVSLAKR